MPRLVSGKVCALTAVLYFEYSNFNRLIVPGCSCCCGFLSVGVVYGHEIGPPQLNTRRAGSSDIRSSHIVHRNLACYNCEGVPFIVIVVLRGLTECLDVANLYAIFEDFPASHTSSVLPTVPNTGNYTRRSIVSSTSVPV